MANVTDACMPRVRTAEHESLSTLTLAYAAVLSSCDAANNVLKSLCKHADFADSCVRQEEKAFCLSTSLTMALALSMCIHQMQVHVWVSLHVGTHSYVWAHPVNSWHRPVYL